MKIIILFASPNKNGSTAILTDHFMRGAKENGHTVEVIDVCKMNIRPCIGCVRCGYEGPCVQKDDNKIIRDTLLTGDMVVFATPLYYYGMSAQLKTVIDRLFEPERQASEIRSADSGVERRQLDVRRARSALQNFSQIYPFRGYGHGAGLRLRLAVDDQAQQISRKSLPFRKIPIKHKVI